MSIVLKYHHAKLYISVYTLTCACHQHESSLNVVINPSAANDKPRREGMVETADLLCQTLKEHAFFITNNVATTRPITSDDAGYHSPIIEAFVNMQIRI